MNLEIGTALFQDGRGAALVFAVKIRVEKTNRDCADSAVGDLFRRGTNVAFVERCHYRAGAIDALGDRQPPLAAHDLLRRRQTDIEQYFLIATPQFQHVAKAARGQHGGRDAAMLQHRIGRNGGTEIYDVDRGEKSPQGLPFALRHQRQRVDDGLRFVARNRRDLAVFHSPGAVLHHDVGERATDIDANFVHTIASNFGGLGLIAAS